MSWMQKLFDTYEQCYDAPQFVNSPLMPVSHATQQAHIEITLDGKGNFRRAVVLPKIETIFPATEKSGARTSGEAPHPLCDKVKYCAADYARFSGNTVDRFTSYQTQLSAWCKSEFTHPRAVAVLQYIEKCALVSDLIKEKILHIAPDGILLHAWTEEAPTPEIFKYLTAKDGKRDQGDAFIRWRVEIPGEILSGTWEDRSLIDAWIKFDAAQSLQQGLCMVSGKTVVLAQSHPKRLRHAGDGAKLISANDDKGFTFLGRFHDAEQALGIGFITTQKAHNALRWLLDQKRKQAFRNGEQTIVAWSIAGKPLPDPFANTSQLFGLDNERQTEVSSYQGDAGQAFGNRLSKYIAGYQVKLGLGDEVVVMGLDAATTGRMAVIYYRTLNGADFLERVQAWHQTCAWHQNFGANWKFLGAPSPRDIAEATYGSHVTGKSGEKLLKATVERLLPCILEGRVIPFDLVRSAVLRTCNRQGQKNWEWEKNLGITCSLFKAHYQNREYQMALEKDRISRDYLYGRLLAVAEHVESRALYLSKEKRDTSSAKLMQRFADHPYATWRTIALSLSPYKTRLRSKRPAFLHEMEKLSDEIVSNFNPDDFMSDARLSGEFLLGYHCQRQALQSSAASGESEEVPTINQ
jgi:CRISPR-associated protein Csd1